MKQDKFQSRDMGGHESLGQAHVERNFGQSYSLSWPLN